MRLFVLLAFTIMAFPAEAQRVNQEAMTRHAISFKMCMFNDAPVMVKCLEEYRAEAAKTLRNDSFAESNINAHVRFLERQSYAYYGCLKSTGVVSPPITREQHELCWGRALNMVKAEDAARSEREREEKRQAEQREIIANLVAAVVVFVVLITILAALWKVVITRLVKKKNSDIEQWRFMFLIMASALLLFAVADLPYGYYTFLRIAVFGAFIFSAITYIDSNKFLTIVFALGAILFNPLIPVHMDKEEWIVIDISAAVFSASVALYTKFGLNDVKSTDDKS
jgi:hypothetical protein